MVPQVLSCGYILLESNWGQMVVFGDWFWFKLNCAADWLNSNKPVFISKRKTQDSFYAWMICYPEKNDTPLFSYVFGEPGATRCAQWQAAILLLKNLRISQARESSGWWVFVRLRWKNHHETPINTLGQKKLELFLHAFCVLHGQNISGCLGLSCFSHGSQWISINLFQKNTDEVITYPNQQFWSFQICLGGQNSSRLARIEGPAKFHCLLHHPAGMQQVVPVEGLKMNWCQTTHNQRHPQKQPRRLKKMASFIWVHFETC